ncbi:unnamed protein product [Adineta steineri]|uniref:Uncharacterized protein n=1 Tax=Adineta steineri TaxID=433720 RepID=A0A820L4W0_9BILA|nr:unnamed protein product [Adineta steineri]
MTNIFTSDEQYLTLPTTAQSLAYGQHEYRPRTLNKSADKARQAILPVFPPLKNGPVVCLAYHRREIVRTIYEFLFSEINVELLDRISKSEETKTNDENWLYRHSARCPSVLELFLNNNPSY